MKLRKPFKIVAILLVAIVVIVGITSIDHPILLKWITGTARHHGRPIDATVYTDGKLNTQIKVFYTDSPNNYLVSLPTPDSSHELRFLNVNLNENWIGRPAATSKRDYDFVAGHLFQSETGGKFVPFQDDIKGFAFDPQLSFLDNEITFNMPPGTAGFESIKIRLL